MEIQYIIVLLFIIMFASFSISQVYGQIIIYEEDFIVERFVTGLDYPTTMDFVGDDIFVLEKNSGKVIRIQDNGIIYDKPVLDVATGYVGESGLLGISSVSNHVYLYFTESPFGIDKLVPQSLHPWPAKNKVYQYDWNGENLINPVLIKELPGGLTTNHHGGTMTVGQNNEIYFVIGDQGQKGIYQNIPVETVYESGSIFKIDTENNNNVELFAMGIRNSFGLDIDPVTGYLWDTENGESYFDEINQVKPRFNSGWSSVMGAVHRDNPDTTGTQTIPSPFENFVYGDPKFSWYQTVGPTALSFPDERFGYSDTLFVADYKHGSIYKFQLNSDRTGFDFFDPNLSDLVLDYNDEMDEILVARGFQGITDIKFHDGVMYVVVIGEGSIYKIYQHLSPLKQYQSGVTHKKIVCKAELMPIMSKSGYVYCVQPKTALILIDVLNWSVNHSEMPKIELKNQNLQGLNFEYLNLSNSDFRGTNFATTNISNANITNTNLNGADLTGANLTGADLTNADLIGTILTGADLTDADLTGVDLSGKDLTRIILRGVDLSNKDLTGTILTGADLTNANLTSANLHAADLTGADLTSANCYQCVFFAANMKNANLTNANLTSANLHAADLTGASIGNAILDNANLKCINHPICN